MTNQPVGSHIGTYPSSSSAMLYTWCGPLLIGNVKLLSALFRLITCVLPEAGPAPPGGSRVVAAVGPVAASAAGAPPSGGCAHAGLAWGARELRQRLRNVFLSQWLGRGRCSAAIASARAERLDHIEPKHVNHNGFPFPCLRYRWLDDYTQ